MTNPDLHDRIVQSRDERILILAPVGRDASMTARYLDEAGLQNVVCPETQTLCHQMTQGCGLVLLTEEALTPEAMHALAQTLPQQPPWSDIPLIVLIRGGGEVPANAQVLARLGEAGNVALIERPVRQATLLSTIRSALRARRRQYEVRDHLAQEQQARQALSQSEERLRIALDAAQLGAWQLDLVTGKLDSTPICKACFGLPADAEFSYEALVEAIHPEDRAAMQTAIENAIRAGDVYRKEHRVVLPDGNLRWILFSGRANYDFTGEPYRIVGVALDVTERKSVEEERERLFAQEQIARAQAEEASRIKDEFLATISHELRTPLNAVLGWTHLLRTGQTDEGTTQHALEVIERNARSQAQLIEDLLDISRIITGKMRLEIKQVELAKVIEASLDAVRPAAEAKNIRLGLELDPLASPIAGDAERLQQVVWNLLTNAVKFTPSGGDVQVKSQLVGATVHIIVRDSGKGIDLKFLPSAFDRFRQADQTSTRSYGGLGLGLSIVRQIVELHGGTVHAHSDGGDLGSTFVVQLPLAIAEPEAPVAIAQIHEPEMSDPLTKSLVLVVEDEADTRDFLCVVLERSGLEVVAASSAAEGLALFERLKPDVLVSDIGMPGEDGYALIAKVRASEKQRGGAIPAIALTAYATGSDRQRALEAGFQKHMTKPVDPNALTTLVISLATPEASSAAT